MDDFTLLERAALRGHALNPDTVENIGRAILGLLDERDRLERERDDLNVALNSANQDCDRLERERDEARAAATRVLDADVSAKLDAATRTDVPNLCDIAERHIAARRRLAAVALAVKAEEDHFWRMGKLETRQSPDEEWNEAMKLRGAVHDSLAALQPGDLEDG